MTITLKRILNEKTTTKTILRVRKMKKKCQKLRGKVEVVDFGKNLLGILTNKDRKNTKQKFITCNKCSTFKKFL